MRKNLARLITLALVAASCRAAPGPTVAQHLVYGDTVVEILGLKSWTPERIATAVKRYAPDVSLASAACAVILRDSVGFADAAVLTLSMVGNDTVWTTIRVVEPTDSSLVRYTRSMRADLPMPSAWAGLDAAFADSPRMISYFQHPEFLLGNADTIFGTEVPAEAKALRNALRSYRSAADREAALEILHRGANRQPRQVAALVISNFSSESSTWYALVEAFRAGSDGGASVAQMVFGALARSGNYTINWEPATDALSAVISGTNLFAYDKLLSGLVDTGIDQDLARRLARLNPALLADHVVALNRSARLPARRYLIHAGSPDFGEDRAAWLRWLEQ